MSRPRCVDTAGCHALSGLARRGYSTEHEVLGHVATGSDNHEIAALLHLSEKTVRNQVATILAKLQLRDRAAAVAAARDRGLGQPG